jgi:hypothetical protein
MGLLLAFMFLWNMVGAMFCFLDSPLLDAL